MQKTWIKWLLAILITLFAAYYQRATGPTHPLRGKVQIAAQEVIKYALPRSHGGKGGQEVTLSVPDTSVHAVLHFKRFKMKEDWTLIPMQRQGNKLSATLPHQPPAGKLEYFITLKKVKNEITVPQKNTVVIRYKGYVPPYVLVPHILLMFLSMLFANYAGIEAVFKGPKIKTYTLVTLIVLFFGGMIMGPIVQKLAFGAYWTGVPFGFDLTDNKTLIAFVFWLLAWWRVAKSGPEKGRWWVILAAVVMLAVFMIPHSMMGSELNYQTMTVETGG